MNLSKPITEDQLLGLLKLIAVIGGNPGMLKPVELAPQMKGYPPEVGLATRKNFEDNLAVVKQLAQKFGAMK